MPPFKVWISDRRADSVTTAVKSQETRRRFPFFKSVSKVANEPRASACEMAFRNAAKRIAFPNSKRLSMLTVIGCRALTTQRWAAAVWTSLPNSENRKLVSATMVATSIALAFAHDCGALFRRQYGRPRLPVKRGALRPINFSGLSGGGWYDLGHHLAPAGDFDFLTFGNPLQNLGIVIPQLPDGGRFHVRHSVARGPLSTIGPIQFMVSRGPSGDPKRVDKWVGQGSRCYLLIYCSVRC
jgi:hypothetical protein